MPGDSCSGTGGYKRCKNLLQGTRVHLKPKQGPQKLGSEGGGNGVPIDNSNAFSLRSWQTRAGGED